MCVCGFFVHFAKMRKFNQNECACVNEYQHKSIDASYKHVNKVTNRMESSIIILIEMRSEQIIYFEF